MLTIISDYILQIAYAFFSLLQELGFHFFLGLLICAAILTIRRKSLGKIVAIACVALFPACNYKASSLAAGIAFHQRRGAVSTIAFLVATLISPAAFAYIIGLFGWAFALIYVAMTAFAAWIIWMLSSHLRICKEDRALAMPASQDGEGPNALASRLSSPLLFLRYTTPRVAAALLLGSALFSILSPILGQFIQDLLARTPLLSPTDIIAVAFGMHFCAPDDFALVALVAQSGLPIGAASVLMFLGPLTNLPEVFALAAIAGKRHLLVYAAAAVSSAVAFGISIQALARLGVVGNVAPIDASSFVAVVNQAAISTPSFLALPCAIALLLLGLYGVFLMSRQATS